MAVSSLMGVAAMLTVAASPADAAGPLTQRCTNAEYGFSVSFPSDWSTNQPADVEGSSVAACTLFAPFAGIEVLPEVVNVPIFLKHESGTPPGDGRAVTVDGRPGVLSVIIGLALLGAATVLTWRLRP